MREAKEMKSTLYPRFQRSYAELVALLAALGNEMPSLPPSESDVKASGSPLAAKKVAATAQPRVVRRLRVRTRPPAQEVTEVSLAAALMTAASVLEGNPWANPAAAANLQQATNAEPDQDDELYE